MEFLQVQGPGYWHWVRGSLYVSPEAVITVVDAVGVSGDGLPVAAAHSDG